MEENQPGVEGSIENTYREYQTIAARAVEVFGDQFEAARWLSSSSRDFAGRTPLQVLTDRGVDLILLVLGRIEHGVFF